MIKKTLSLILALLMIVSCLPYVASADNIVIENTLAMVDAATVRNGKSHRDVVQGNTQLVADYTGNNRRFGYVKFDFSTYKDDIDSLTEVKLSFVPYTPVSNITVGILPDSLEDWSSGTLTYSMAEAAGMTDVGSDGVLCTVDNLVNGTRTSTPDLSAAVIEHLKNNPSNTVVCFKIHSTQGSLSVIQGAGSKPLQLLVKLNVDIDELVQKNYDALTFDKISTEPVDAVTSNLKLITEGTYGTKITWTASSTDIDVESGIIRRPRKGEGDKEVTLTATIENTGTILTKEFDIILKESNIYSDDLVLSENVYAADSTFVRYYQNVVNNGDIVCDPSTGNHRMGFVKFDFTGYEDILEKANSMQLKIDTKTDANVANKSDFNAYLLPQEMENIDTATLTYNDAKSAGLIDYWDNILFRQKDVAKVTTYYSDDILSAIKKNIDEGGDSIVWLKFAATTGIGYTINGSIAGEANKPTLIIKYPKPATELDSRTLTIDTTVSGNINLPAVGEYGSEISWISSNESLISSSGEVTVGTADEDYSKEDSVATLTATFTADGVSVEKDFSVRVRRNGVYDVVKSATVTSDGAVLDSATLSVGGTIGRMTLLEFDISENLSQIQGRRKTVLKLYGSDEYYNKNLTIVPVTDVSVLAGDIEDISYDEAKSITAEANNFKLSGNFEENEYITFDITEYLQSLTGSKAMFVLCSTDPQIILESQNGILGKEPKLIVSPIAYTDKYAAQTAADDVEFSDLTSEKPDFIRNNLTLPTSGRFGSTITWHSSNEDIVKSDGTVTRGLESTDITLTATVTVGSESVTKAFEFNVRKAETDLEYAQSLAKELAPDLTILTQSIALKGESLPDGAIATWESSEPYEAKVNGFNLELTRPNSADLPVTLTVSVTYNGQIAKESFNVILVRSAGKNILRNRKIVAGDSLAEKAIDEDITTVWEISNSSVTIDLNSSRVISGMTIVPENTSFAGLTISTSDDAYQWKTAYNGGDFKAGKLNYITFSSIAYGRYLKFDFPSSASAISFIGAYSFADEQADDVFASVTVPGEAITDFALAQNIYGNPITWTSSSNSIVVSGYTARVNRTSSAKNVTLTAEVTINNEIHSKSYVVYVPATSGGGSMGGGGGSSFGGSGMIATPTVTPQAPVTPQTPDSGISNSFSDISGVPWAADYINKLAKLQIINGKSQTTFAPNDNLKREEIAKILVLAFELQSGSDDDAFADVDSASWYADYVKALYNNNITTGIGDGNFGVGLDITRQDAFTMLAKVMGIDTVSDGETATSFGDDNEIASYARGSINALVKMGIVGGDNNGMVNPTAKITRAEIAKVICLAMDK